MGETLTGSGAVGERDGKRQEQPREIIVGAAYQLEYNIECAQKYLYGTVGDTTFPSI